MGPGPPWSPGAPSKPVQRTVRACVHQSQCCNTAKLTQTYAIFVLIFRESSFLTNRACLMSPIAQMEQRNASGRLMTHWVTNGSRKQHCNKTDTLLRPEQKETRIFAKGKAYVQVCSSSSTWHCSCGHCGW